jgi:hypothetical protein
LNSIEINFSSKIGKDINFRVVDGWQSIFVMFDGYDRTAELRWDEDAERYVPASVEDEDVPELEEINRLVFEARSAELQNGEEKLEKAA